MHSTARTGSRRKATLIATAIGVATLTLATTAPAAARLSAKAPAGTWRMLPAAPIKAAPDLPVVSVWTGRQLIIHGTRLSPNGADWHGLTFAYRPATNTWMRLPNGPHPLTIESTDVAVWTGSRMLVFGLTNGSYSPATNTWRRIAPPGFPLGGAVTAWTGHRFLAWGGNCCESLSRDGAVYNPVSNTWRNLPSAPLARRRHAAGAWTGKELIVAGGRTDTRRFRTGAAYNLATNTWRKLPLMPGPPSSGPTLWDGKEVLFLRNGGSRGMAYNPTTNRWRLLPAMPFPRTDYAALWTGRQVLVWGGLTGQIPNQQPPAHGEAYSPAANRWSALPGAPLRGRGSPVAVWTGRRMIVWGGYIPRERTIRNFVDGAAFTPGVA